MQSAKPKGDHNMSNPFSVLHDIHCHSFLSACCKDETCTAENVFQQARETGYDTLCLTDHLWDSAVPGASNWYAPQDIPHVLSAKPVPQYDGMRCLLGCETEYTGNGHLGLAKEHFDLFDFVVIPPNHMHMIGFVRPEDVTTPAQMAQLFTQRLNEISQLDIPMEKVGIAHITCSLLFREGKVCDVVKLMGEEKLHPVFARFAARGAGIELNKSAFKELDEDPENTLRLYRIAKEEGCKFYCSSDSHTLAGYQLMGPILRRVADLLELTEDDRYIIP